MRPLADRVVIGHRLDSKISELCSNPSDLCFRDLPGLTAGEQ